MGKPKKITDAWLARWKPSANRQENEVGLGVMGLTAVVQAGGEIAFIARITLNGNRPSETVGKFVDGEFGIEQAMEAASKWRNKQRAIAEGRDTVNAKDVPDFKGLLDRWEKVKADSRTKHWKDERHLIEKVYAPVFGRPMLAIQKSDLEDCHVDYLSKRMKEIGRRPVTSIRRAYNCVKPILIYARDHRWTRPELLTGWKTGLKREPSRTRILTPRELQLVLPALDALPKRNGLYALFLLLTGARLTMPSTMRWKDIRKIDVGTYEEPEKMLAWCVPAIHMKGAYEAVFPLVGDSLRIVEMFRAEAGGNPKADAFVWPDSPRNAWTGNADYWNKEVFELSGTKKWHRHDLRRTAASLLKHVGADMETVKLCLDHRERDEDDSDTPRYVVIEDNGPGLKALAGKLEEMHALLRQIEEGRDSKQLRALYTSLQRSPKVMRGLAKADIDLDTMLEIVPNEKHGRGKVRELRASN
jgi:integrase